jgi:hypothetical protein
MKRWMFFAAPVTVALVLGLVVYALPASGSSTSLISRVAKLESQAKALKAQNTALAKRVKKLEVTSSCLDQLAPMAEYGNPDQGTGYRYSQDNDVTELNTTAIDLIGQGETPQFIALGVNPQCVATTRALTAHIRGLSKPARVITHAGLRRR